MKEKTTRRLQSKRMREKTRERSLDRKFWLPIVHHVRKASEKWPRVKGLISQKKKKKKKKGCPR